MSEPRIIVHVSEGIARMTINRPEKHNAMDVQFFQEFGPCIEVLSDDDEIRAIIITGAGRSFCSGIDLVSLGEVAQEPSSVAVGGPNLSEPFGLLQSVVSSLRACRKPVVAAVNGLASGMGMSLLCLCDYRVASEQASFAPGFIRMGLAGELGITYVLPRLIGFQPALKFLSTGETRDTTWAEKAGLVDEVVPLANLKEAAQAFAVKLTQMPPLAVSMVKQLLYRSIEGDLDSQLQSEAFAASILLKTEDCHEAVTAFLTRRPPVFKGR